MMSKDGPDFADIEPPVKCNNDALEFMINKDKEFYSCGCPLRCLPPNPPTALPYAATEANIPKLKAWMKDYYADSSFNKCESQKLPLMTGFPPLEFHVDNNFKPTVISKSATIPVNWYDQVKAEIDRDVAMGC